MSLEKYITQIQNAKSEQEAFDVFSRIAKNYGYDYVLYNFLTDHNSLNIKKRHAVIGNYPKDWIKYYKEKQFLQHDPVHNNVLNSPLPFLWSDIAETQPLTNKSSTLMNEANEAGLKGGFGIPLYSCMGEIAGIGLARSSNEKSENYEDLAQLQFIAKYFHESYKTFLKDENTAKVTEREREILLWASEGKSDEDIALILSIRRRTVRFHWNNIFEKLNVYNRTYAVTKALYMQIITPALVAHTCT